MALNEMHAEAIAGVVDRVVSHHRRDPANMVQMLREIQESCDWLPPEAIDRLSATLAVPRTKIEGVAGFYAFFHTQPRGKFRVLFSDNITDRMLGNRALLDRLCNSLTADAAHGARRSFDGNRQVYVRRNDLPTVIATLLTHPLARIFLQFFCSYWHSPERRSSDAEEYMSVP